MRWVLVLDNDAMADFSVPLIPAPRHNHPTCAAPYWQCWTIARYLECRVSVWYLRYAVDDGSTHTPKQMTMTKAKTTALRHRSTVPMATGLRRASTLPHAVDRGGMLLTMTLVLTSKKSTLQYSAEKSCGVGGLSREVIWFNLYLTRLVFAYGYFHCLWFLLMVFTYGYFH